MKILIVSEKFVKGGLETHINTYYDLIKDASDIYFAFSKYEDNGYLKDAKIYDNFNFNFNSTISEFCSDVENLVKIIRENNIDIVHVHPFYSFFPALFATAITNVKLVYTYHGYGSINFISSNIDSMLFLYGIENKVDKVFCVAENAIEYFKELHNQNIIFLPNIIDEDIYKEHDVINNKKWALISRIDADKYQSIIKFFDMLPKLDIDRIDIYGSGNREDKLKEYITKNKLSNKIKLKGFTNKIYNILDNYTGTIGIGRVTLESLCMNYPSILIGYDKVLGVINEDLYNEVKKINFVPAALDDIDIEEFNKQLKKINKGNYKHYQLRKNVIKDFGKNKVNTYLEELKNCKKITNSTFNEMFNEFNNISDKNEHFYTSQSTFDIISKKIAANTKNPYFKIIINSYVTNNTLINRQNNMKDEFNAKIEDLSKKLDKVIEENNEYKNGRLYKISHKLHSFRSKKKVNKG